jgi:HK97 family phage major capsid protein
MRQAIPIPMISYKYQWPTADKTSVTATWPVGEKTALPKSVLATSSLTLEAKRMGTYLEVTNDLLDDTGAEGLAVLDFLLEIITEAIGKKIDLTFFQGDADGADHTYMDGVFNADLSGVGSYELTVGVDTYAELVARDFRKLIAEVPPEEREGCGFYYCPAAGVYVETLEDENSRPVYRQPAGEKPATLYGQPPYETSRAPDNDGEDALPLVVFGSIRKNCLLGWRKEIAIETTRILKFLENMTTVKVECKPAMAIPHTSRWIQMLSNTD